MYNIKGPSKIVAKTTRRGLSQSIDNFKDYKNKMVENEESEISNVPKPTFHKKSSPTVQRSNKHLSPQHEEIINFINESWNSVCAEMDQENVDSDERTSSHCEQTICYYEDEPCLSLQDFKPFDLESWWGKRLYAYVTNSVNAKG